MLLLLARVNLYLNFVNVILEITFFHGSIRECHFTVAVLDSTVPFTLIPTTVSPSHFSISVSIIFIIFTLVLITTGPDESSESMLFIIFVFTVVNVARRSLGTAPFTFTVFHTSFEQTDISSSICPGILTLSVGFSLYVIPGVRITIDE